MNTSNAFPPNLSLSIYLSLSLSPSLSLSLSLSIYLCIFVRRTEVKEYIDNVKVATVKGVGYDDMKVD